MITFNFCACHELVADGHQPTDTPDFHELVFTLSYRRPIPWFGNLLLGGPWEIVFLITASHPLEIEMIIKYLTRADYHQRPHFPFFFFFSFFFSQEMTSGVKESFSQRQEEMQLSILTFLLRNQTDLVSLELDGELLDSSISSSSPLPRSALGPVGRAGIHKAALRPPPML